ncbi:hypothetical protein ONZ45_g189 [Pleurotus djamor]|nr:hypothetical protein ONZ45_g189 [Pleurotus djamor]
MSTTATTESNATFRRLKLICVPLLGTSSLSPASIPTVLKLLDELHNALQSIISSEESLGPSLISYVFFPLSTILRRNAPSVIPDRVLEKVFICLAVIVDAWWWNCDLDVWEQLLILCGSVVTGLENKERRRDEETVTAAVQCLLTLLRERTIEDALRHTYTLLEAESRLHVLQERSKSPKLLPILGQTLSALLDTAQSRYLILQTTSLRTLSSIISLYAPDNLVPSVLPGVMSSMVKIALGTSGVSRNAPGEVVAGALQVISDVIVKAIGDEICIKEGVIRPVKDLEDLATLESISISPGGEVPPLMTVRTVAWLQGTSSQVHIALNSLKPLVSHGNSLALVALIKTSTTILQGTHQSLPQSTPLMISFLLSLSTHALPVVSSRARESLVTLLTTSNEAQHRFLQVTMQMTRDNLTSLPRLITTQSDAKIEYAAKIVEAVCLVATDNLSGDKTTLRQIRASVGTLLGPSGGIEKWGWTLLSVLDFVKPTVVEYNAGAFRLLEAGSMDGVAFTYIPLRCTSSRETYDTLERMFHALGRAAGDECLFAIEWFANIGSQGTSDNSTSALWCACRLMEGLGEMSLLSGQRHDPMQKPSKRLSKVSRMLAKKFGDLWDNPITDQNSLPHSNTDEQKPDIEFVQGVVPLHRTLKLVRESTVKRDAPLDQPHIHRAFSLQLIALCAGVLQSQFSPLLLYSLYPVLHSLTSPETLVSATGLATLDYLSTSMSYASPTNLLLSNFDYALDGVSRKLTKRWLDIDATKVLVLLVRLVGSDVVDKAGDIVEECFTRLDEYHGYDVLVDGLVEVLGEVIKAIDVGSPPPKHPGRQADANQPRQSMDGLFEWIAHRHDPAYEKDEKDYGPAPRKAWGEEGKDTQDTQGTNDPQKSDDEDLSSPSQRLAKQIVDHSLFFLTHGSPVIRARILDLLASSVPILPHTAILSSIHQAWPFVLNRLTDPHAFVVGAAAALIEALSVHVGAFMYKRIWDDVWPRFSTLLGDLDRAEGMGALARRGVGAVGTESAYTHSHRLYRSILKTMTAAIGGVDPQDSSLWQVIIGFRRFLHKQAHEELQTCARALYLAVGNINEDAVWLVLSGTSTVIDSSMKFMYQPQWDISDNVDIVLKSFQ